MHSNLSIVIANFQLQQFKLCAFLLFRLFLTMKFSVMITSSETQEKRLLEDTFQFTSHRIVPRITFSITLKIIPFRTAGVDFIVQN